MADTNGGDVERHFTELEKQLQEDGFDPESQVMKTTSRLMKALRSDGFAFADSEDESEEASADAAESPTEEAVAETVVEEKPVKSRKIKSVLRAFRAKDAFDTSVIAAVFAEIEGWTTKVIEHKGHHFVIATNGPAPTMDQVKKALGEYAQEARAATAA